MAKSPDPRDLIERLRAEMAAVEDELRGPPFILRVIQGHREVLDRHAPMADGAARKLGFFGLEPLCSGCGNTWANCPDVRSLVSIYFPEGTR